MVWELKSGVCNTFLLIPSSKREELLPVLAFLVPIRTAFMGIFSNLSFNFASTPFNSFVKLKNSFFLVLAIIQLLLVTLSILFFKISAYTLKSIEKDKIESIHSVVKTQIEYETSKGLLPLLVIQNNDNILNSFAKQDRSGLLQITKPLYDSLKQNGIKQLQFNSSNLLSFLRIHHPEQFGDDLSSYRPMVQRVNLDKKTLVGLEQGRSGYGFRTVTPVFWKKNGEYIGTIELGSSLDGIFLDHLRKLFPGNWVVFNLNSNNSSLAPQIIAKSREETKNEEAEELIPKEEILSKTKLGNLEYEFDSETDQIFVYMPIKNFNHEVALLFVYSYETSYYRYLKKIGIYSIGVAIFGLISSGFILIFLYRKITHPIRDLVLETKKIREFRLEENVNIESSVVEIQDLVDSISSMKQGLHSFRKYVPAELVRELIETKQEASIGGLRRNLTIMFTDISNFTTISEEMRPSELAVKLSEYLEVVTKVIIKNKGTVDKYIGDAVMAFWGAPRDLEDHAGWACLAALEIQKEIHILNESWTKQGKNPLRTRIGVNTGDTIVGNIGSNQRLNYTVIGDPVNLASRLEALNKSYGTSIIISKETQESCSGKFETRRLDKLQVKGKTEPVSIFELISEKGDLSAKEAAFINKFEEALLFFNEARLADAKSRFLSLQSEYPDNKSIQFYLEKLA